MLMWRFNWVNHPLGKHRFPIRASLCPRCSTSCPAPRLWPQMPCRTAQSLGPCTWLSDHLERISRRKIFPFLCGYAFSIKWNKSFKNRTKTLMVHLLEAGRIQTAGIRRPLPIGLQTVQSRPMLQGSPQILIPWVLPPRQLRFPSRYTLKALV